MSAITPSGYGRMDVSTWQGQFPRPASAGAVSQQSQGVAMPTQTVPAAGGNPAFPWVGFFIALVALRAFSHFRKG